jgi:dolichol-phosphate mannosyltransferase
VRRLLRMGAARLQAFPALAGLVRFGLVGASGVLVNLALLIATLRFTGLPQSAAWHACAETLATQVAIVWNFGLTETWVFPTAAVVRAPRLIRFSGYWLASMVALAVQLPLTAALVRVLPIGYAIGTALALSLLVVARYLVCRGVLYRPSGAAALDAAPPVALGLHAEDVR